MEIVAGEPIKRNGQLLNVDLPPLLEKNRISGSGFRENVERPYIGRPGFLDEGGYLPAVDHSVPHDISFENYTYYAERQAHDCERYLSQWAG